MLSSHGRRWFPGAVEHFGKWLSLEIRAALDAGKPVVVEVEHRGFTPDGELRHPVIRGWEID